jgi:hypothetical protein
VELFMRKRIRLMVMAAFAVALSQRADAASFGTASWAELSPYGDQPSVHVGDLRTDVWPATSSASLADAGSSAVALTPFGVNQASVASQPGTSAYAASLWSDTFTITNDDATGTANVGFHLAFGGTLDAGSGIGGWSQFTLRALVGTGTSGDTGLAPAIVLDAAAIEASEACGLDGDDLPSAGCIAGVVDASGALDLETAVVYGTPFRLVVLLEALARDGGVAEFAPGGWLTGIELPAGASFSAASGWNYSGVVAQVPEPGTALLCALGCAALASRSARG